MNKKTIRIEKLQSILNESGLISIREMAARLDVSEMTVRRDIRQLEQEEKVKNINGMLISPKDSSFSLLAKHYELNDESRTQDEAKRAIGRFAAEMIREDDRVFFDIGTTIEQVVKFIPQNRSFKGCCVSLNTLLQLTNCSNAAIAVAGGFYQPNIQAFLGEESVKFIQNFRAGKVFLSAAGIHEDLGVSCVSTEEVRIKKAMLQSSARHVLVTDSSKFGVIRSGYVCGLNEIDEIVTDDRLPDKWVNLIENRGIVLHRVPVKKDTIQ